MRRTQSVDDAQRRPRVESSRLGAVALSLLLVVAACGPQAPEADPATEPVASDALTDGLLAHRPAVPGVQGLVTAGHPLAAMAGMQMLTQGGTAADAAVAVLATLNLVEPMMSGAGGNGFFTIFDAATGEVVSLNATGAAPRALDASALSSEELERGIHAGVVPGLLGGWIALLERYGVMSLETVLAPAIRYAEQGHPVDAYVARSLEASRELFEAHATTAAVFLPDGELPKPGAMVRFPQLARTFRRLLEAEDTARLNGGSRESGLQAAFRRFYRGDIARDMARFYQDRGGAFTRDDFARYEPIWAEPVRTTYRGYDVYSSPTTSRGGLEVLMQLNLVEDYDLAALGHNSAEALHLVAEAIKVTKADVYAYAVDPAQASMPTAGLVSKTFADGRRALIDRGRAMAFPEAGVPDGAAAQVARALPAPRPGVDERSVPGSTTSFTVVDAAGNVVVATPTLGSVWGTGVVVGETGLFFNNGSRVGSTAPYPEHVNYARGGQVPILNNSPTFVLKDGEPVLALGTPGGETIGQTQFQVLLNVLDFGLGIQEAVEAPRISLDADPNFYRAGADVRVRVEGRMAPTVTAELARLGHEVEPVSEYVLGNMQAVFWTETGAMLAGADPRRMMYAVGW